MFYFQSLLTYMHLEALCHLEEYKWIIKTLKNTNAAFY